MSLLDEPEKPAALPRSLFKYVPPERIHILEKFEISYTPRSVFNDPFDLLPAMKDIELMDLLAQTMRRYEKDRFNLSLRGVAVPPRDEYLRQRRDEAIQSTIAIYENQSLLKTEAVERFGVLLDFNVGVLSLTETENDLLMWAHYASCHTGFIIEFAPERMSFPAAERVLDLNLPGIAKVKYSNSRPTMPWTGTFDPLTVLATKSDHWAYEREWRGIRRLDGCSRKFKKDGRVISLFKVESNCVRRVIAGCRMTKENQSRLIAAAGRLENVAVEIAAPSIEHFALKYSPVPYPNAG